MKVSLSDLLSGSVKTSLSEYFSETHYIEKYDDVRTSDIDPFEHYIRNGWKERRVFPLVQGGEVKFIDNFSALNLELRSVFDSCFSSQLNLGISEYKFQKETIETIFDLGFYAQQLDGKLPEAFYIEHYLTVGRKEGLAPNAFFVPEEYAAIYTDIASSDIDESYHYAAQGIKEGRFPRVLDSFDKFTTLPAGVLEVWTSDFFDQEYYLEANPDVAVSDFAPLKHYSQVGWKEGRAPSVELSSVVKSFDLDLFVKIDVNPLLIKHVLSKSGFSLSSSEEAEAIFGSLSEPVDSDLEYEVKTLEQYVDSDFYFALYPDVKSSGLSAAKHFCAYGWKEHRDPSAEFSTVFYLEDNPDVVDAGVNPLFHYVVAGQFERRYPRRPGGEKADLIYHLIPLSKKKEIWKVGTEPNVLEKNEISFSGDAIISISHDRYTQHTGGVQLCIHKEQIAYNDHGIDYIHLAPYQPLPTLSDKEAFGNGNHFLHFTVNGIYQGVARAEDLIGALKNSSASEFKLIYHALHGHSTEFLAELASSEKIKDVSLWLHDYFTICEGYNLLRNEVSPCGAPLPDSKACGVCVFGQQRKVHLARVNELLSVKPYQVIAPSESAKETWLNDRGAVDRSQMQNLVVKEHISLDHRETKELKEDGPVRVAFIGYPSIHKGWAEFCEFVRSTISSGLYEYYHIGAEKSDLLGVKFVECKVTSEIPSLMTETVLQYDIDYVYIAAPWAETFNIVCYEAIAAGARVITHPGSGNVARFVKKSGNGHVVESLSDLIGEHERYLVKPKSKTYFETKFIDMGYGI